MQVNQETLDKLNSLAKVFTKVFDALKEVFKKIVNWALENWNLIKVKAVEFYQLEKMKENKNPQQKWRLNLSHPKMLHQVTDRRPKNMIRKIIR